ncbi:hypothetical protein [Aureivirga sp. CE67]|uniref:hypothetical protein n=1 Tax=Aureivirga sp. CE67 TaxID=1788983 RepID=UPI0018CA01F3|nr:hypothetical protein [Aureivirga sp. CE67]
MKYLKSSLAFLLLTVFVFTSCNNDDDTQVQQIETVSVKKSEGLRTFLNVIKNLNLQNANARTTTDDELCFDFVYPITLGYNDGSTVEVESLNHLIEVLTDETEDLYIEGINFPFDIVFAADDNVMTVESEEDIISALENCEYMEDEEDCFTIQFPINVIIGNETVEFTSMEDLYQEIEYEIVFPITVIDNETGEEIIVENYDQLDELEEMCDEDEDDMDMWDFESFEDCFTFNYPLTMVIQDEDVTFNNDEEFYDFFAELDEEDLEIEDITFVFPFTVTLSDDEETQETMENMDDFMMLIEDCLEAWEEDNGDWDEEDEDEDESDENDNDEEEDETDENDDDENDEDGNESDENDNDEEGNETDGNDEDGNESDENDNDQEGNDSEDSEENNNEGGN